MKPSVRPSPSLTPLPIDKSIDEIIDRLRVARSLVLVAPPGAGKTTRVPPAIVRANLLSREHPNLVMLQPRRVAARAAATRIAEENGWELGREVGYHVRFEKRLSSTTRLRVLTEGILTRQLLDDPFLEGVGAVLLDEFHERSLHTDVAIALLREVRQTVRDDLMLVVMSATLDAEPVSQFLGGCPIVRAEGRMFPVEISYDRVAARSTRDAMIGRIAEAVGRAIESPGDVLVFLPGADEIRRAMRELVPIASQHDLLVLPLHGSLPFEQQIAALRPAPRRKIILATNIAETSLTIDGVTTVIDSGLVRVAGYDAQRGLDRLELKRISKASATQRAGRAGRTAPGRCLRLWTEKEQHALADFELPEVRRVDLAGTVLALHAWGRPDPRAFGWYESPDDAALAAAEQLLEMLGALGGDGKISALGRRIVSLPAHPRIARLLIAAADVGRLEDGATLAALLAEKDIVREDRERHPRDRVAKTQASSDLLVRAEMLDRGGAEIDSAAAAQVARTREELARLGKRLSDRASRIDGDEVLLRAILAAYPDRVCRRRDSDPSAGAMVGGGGVRLAAESVVRQGELFVALDARHDARSPTREAIVRIASAVRFEWIEEMFSQSIRRERKTIFDDQRQRVVGRGTVWYRDLLLREDRDAAVDPVEAGATLAEALRPRAREIFQSEESANNWLARLALLRDAMPEHPWPEANDAALGELLARACTGKRSVDEVRRANLLCLLQSQLSYPLDRLFEQHAPETIAVPSGNRIRVTYAIGQPPVLAVRLQELFGWTDTPRIAGGRVPVVLHLLAPNFRPVQITDDLRSFWATTYFQVRKDLRTRYPKHAWPEDPLKAKAEAKGRPRR